MTGRGESAEQLDRARALFEAGQIVEAAVAIRALSLQAAEANDAGLRAEIQEMVAQMRGHLAGLPELWTFNIALEHGRTVAGEEWFPAPKRSRRRSRRRLWLTRLLLVLGAIGLFVAGASV